MVNGATSRIFYIGAWVSILACVLGIVYLSAGDHTIPSELMMALTGSFGVIGGAHLMPPISRAATEKALRAEEIRATKGG